jgi:uncharacterized membrane protein
VAGRFILAVFFIMAGLLHFLFPEPYSRIVPPFLPLPRLLVFISGIAEIAGGAGLLVPEFQRVAAYGLVLLLLAVFPANIYMAVAPRPISGLVRKIVGSVATLAASNTAYLVGSAIFEEKIISSAPHASARRFYMPSFLTSSL